MNDNADETDKYFQVILKLIHDAGSVVCEAFSKSSPDHLRTKTSDIDLVTETDQAVEQMLVENLKHNFPKHRFIGEETTSEIGADSKNCLTDDPTWIIDPIDGTTNFVHRLPMTCISVGLWIKKRPCIGVIYNPILRDLYTARIGHGAYLNGFRIYASGTSACNRALVATTFGSTRDAVSIDNYMKNLKTLIDHGIRGHRSFGSAAINMALVAQGSLDAYVEYGIHCWDMAAAALIVSEAGGCVIDPAGGPFDLMSRRVICAGSEKLAHDISKLLIHTNMSRDD